MASSDPKAALLSTQTEKPNHYTYLKEFRVEQCPSFLQHKCNQHRPFVCFNWHFMNQRRRRPVRRRDGSFNYSADNYCTKYDETTGICPDGDDCPFLHRTAGDTERRYHLRYYKTCMCVHDTDARGYCVKNGHHCAFAHGIHDQRPPVYDIKELEAMQAAEASGESMNGPNVLDKERNLMNEDPKWQDTNYVLANYKTEPCKRPPRLCRQGYACPQYHNSKDKRRSPRKYKYRSTPCPSVKHGEEWGEPANCEAGDNCQYCHTRTEQQFHPEIYKSTKCNDVQQAGYCPRSVFCAFAHVEHDMTRRDTIHGLDNSISAGIASSGLLASSSAPVNIPGSPMGNSISGLLQGTSAPVNIPGSSLGNNFSPSSHSNLFGMNDNISSAPKLATSFGHSNTDSLFFQSHIISPVLTGGDGGLSASPELSRISELNSLNNELSNNNTNLLFDNHMQQAAVAAAQQQQQQVQHQQQAAAAAAIAAAAKNSNANHPYSMSPLTVLAEQQRDEALSHVKALKEKLEQVNISGNSTANYRASDLRGLPLPKLKNIQAKLRAEIEEVEKVLYLETATKCMKCEENNRSVTLVPCNHYVLCDVCAATQRECPYCQTPVTSQA
ncbi:AAEL012456-PA [Aedes aegypti]|uniref:AAEL012456-PA n=1 Tax=Aedes aegypti TaxID=7159 RepID=Q16M10_AEDAE|nr:AAEL012456-PA [Aedes aegypti]